MSSLLVIMAGVLGGLPAVLLALIDLRSLRLPDPLVAVLGLGAGVPLALLAPARIGLALLAGLLVGAGYLLIALLPGDGLGLGDVKLGAVLAVLLGLAGGWPVVLIGLFAAHLIGAGVAVFLLATRRRRIFPFGPALLLGALISVVTAA
ncbi:prepilin peptidase [Actinoplanes cyaneus]|nr:prepilin peptidase [Actinoplanes cyaneus]MCW2138939.1 leader peptidase (prepilin peptidase) / N-methyltransferase [Actinoplanes cyaneus]